MKVKTRFAPSPTGFLHIGSARTAIFNYLFAKHYGGEFLLRIEDTDKARSTKEAFDAIINGLKWLGVKHDGEIVIQSQMLERHKEVAYELLKRGKAYKCFMSQEEIDVEREKAVRENKSFLLRSPWRDKSESEHPKDSPFVIRIKAPRSGSSVINDLVQGEVKVSNEILDDLVLLRSDGTPTYMLAVVVDDHDMNITHIIRGDDHLNNAFRQKIIYEAMDWNVPEMGHIPLIHGEDGAKLSKRHGAIGVEAYRDMGYVPDALFNYLLRLGWSHGDDEIIPKDEAIKWFDGAHLGKAPSRIDFAKMRHVNSIYIKNMSTNDLIAFIEQEWKKENIAIDQLTKANLLLAIDEIKVRSELVGDLANIAKIYHVENLYPIDQDAMDVISSLSKYALEEMVELISNIKAENKEGIQEIFKAFASQKGIKLGEVMKPLRAILTGKLASPSVFEIIQIIGKKKTLERIARFYDDSTV